MVDVRGFVNNHHNREWNIKTEQCQSCEGPITSNLEWCLRNSILQMLIGEKEIIDQIFIKFPDIYIHCELPVSVENIISHSFLTKSTIGVYAQINQFKTPIYPVIFQGKLFQMIYYENHRLITKQIWDNFEPEIIKCLFCHIDEDYIWPGIFLLKGRIYTIGNLGWTNFARVHENSKYGITMYTSNTILYEKNCSLLRNLYSMKDSLKYPIGNKKIYQTNILMRMLFSCIQEINRYQQLDYMKHKQKIDFKIRSYLRRQNVNLNTGIIDNIIGKRTNFLNSLTENRHFDQFKTGRYKTITKLDYSLICKLFNLDLMVSHYAKKIPVEFHDNDFGFICPVSTSEQHPGLLNLELVVGTFISCDEDCASENVICDLLKEKMSFTLIESPTTYEYFNEGYFMILNNIMYRINHLEELSRDWLDIIQIHLKTKIRCIEIYILSNILFIYSYPNTIFIYKENGLAYSQMDCLDGLDEESNIFGPSCSLISYINSNKNTRNTYLVHAFRQAAGLNFATKYDILDHQIDIIRTKTKYSRINHLPIYLQWVNILLCPHPLNVDDSLIVSRRSCEEYNLFKCKHSYIIHIILKIIEPEENIDYQKTSIHTTLNDNSLLKPGLIVMNFNKNVMNIIHMNKNLRSEQDLDSPCTMNIIWEPNKNFIDSIREQVLFLGYNYYYSKKDGQISYILKLEFEERPSLGTKVVIVNGCQKSVISSFIDDDEIPQLVDINTKNVIDLEIDIIQNPMVIKKQALNFLFTVDNDGCYMNDCFKHTYNDKVKILSNKKDYFIKNRRSGIFYKDCHGNDVKVLVYKSPIILMHRQSPKITLHSSNLNQTPLNELTHQPECRATRSVTENNHAFGLSESERETLTAVGTNSIIEGLYNLSDPDFIDLGGNSIPLSYSTQRTLDMLYLNGLNFSFNLKSCEKKNKSIEDGR